MGEILLSSKKSLLVPSFMGLWTSGFDKRGMASEIRTNACLFGNNYLCIIFPKKTFLPVSGAYAVMLLLAARLPFKLP